MMCLDEDKRGQVAAEKYEKVLTSNDKTVEILSISCYVQDVRTLLL